MKRLNVLQFLDVCAEDMDYVAAKIGNMLLLSPVGLAVVCGTIVILAGLFFWSRSRPTV